MRDDNGTQSAVDDEPTALPDVRVLVALGINPSSERLLRTAARLADELQGQLIALHIAPPGAATKLYRSNLERHLQQARSLGAEVHIVDGSDVAATLVRQARTLRATHLVVGQSDVSRWREITRGSVMNRILRLILQQGGGTDLYIVTASSRF